MVVLDMDFLMDTSSLINQERNLMLEIDDILR